MTFQQFLLILRARWWVAIAVLVTVTAVAITVSLLLPKQYTSTAAVIVDTRGADPIDGVAQAAALMPSYVATQVDVIQSDRVAQRAIEILGLSQSPVIVAQWHEATGGRGTVVNWLGSALRSNLTVRPSVESNVINISFTGIDPQFSTLVANAFAQAYIDTNLALRVEPARQYVSFFDERTQQLRKKLEEAQSRLSAYQREKGISGNNNFDVESARLAELSTQVAAAQGQSAATASRRVQASGDVASSPDVLSSGIVQQLRADVARQSARLRELGSRLGPNHPQYQEAQSQLGELQARLNSEMSQAAASVGSASRADAQRESSLRSALAEQQRRVLAASEERAELAVLQRDVENAQRAYDQITQRLGQTELESAVRQTDVSILTPATEPFIPSSPNVRLNALLAVIVGTFLGVASALVLELVDRRVRSEADLDLPGIPVLVSLTQSRRYRWLAAAQAYFKRIGRSRAPAGAPA